MRSKDTGNAMVSILNGYWPIRSTATGKTWHSAKREGIQVCGPALGKPKKDPRSDRKQEYKDAVDRIEIERRFSLAKRCYGLGLIKTKLDTTIQEFHCIVYYRNECRQAYPVFFARISGVDFSRCNPGCFLLPGV